MLDETKELSANGGGVARVRASPRRVRRLDELGGQLPSEKPLRGQSIGGVNESVYSAFIYEAWYFQQRLQK